MAHPDLSDKPVLYWGLRQAESIGEALFLALNRDPPLIGNMRQWLRSQEVPDRGDLPIEGTRLKLTLDEGFEQGVGMHREYLVRGSNAPTEDMVYCGEERSGAGWRDPANFVVTSAFVRLLGAWEQFELDVVKALFYYRPNGEILGDDRDSMMQKLEPEVIREKPERIGDKEIYAKPPLWTWMRKHAENNVERSKILKNVFHIDPIPKGYNQKTKEDWYAKRNKIAHGREGVKMTLGEYIQVDVLVAKAMLHLHEECKLKLKLIV